MVEKWACETICNQQGILNNALHKDAHAIYLYFLVHLLKVHSRGASKIFRAVKSCWNKSSSINISSITYEHKSS